MAKFDKQGADYHIRQRRRVRRRPLIIWIRPPLLKTAAAIYFKPLEAAGGMFNLEQAACPFGEAYKVDRYYSQQ
jgi:hypothetical protein